MNDATRRALRTFAQVFIGIFALSLLGWLADVQEWATCVTDACRNFPDPSVLGKAAIAAAAGGVSALVAWVQNILEDNTSFPAVFKAPASPGENPVP